ncbi:MAG: citrate (Si)-synthase [Candidatus Riflebacteria bacterium]|nr:citrate (Si)-synthase [Candidatus Riflebacteria bacterium]
MYKLKEKLQKLIPVWRDEIKSIQKEYGEKVISQVTVAQAYGGMRAVKSLICDTSEVPPDKGLLIRGVPVKDLTDKLPEEVFWFLLTGEHPTKDELKDLQGELVRRNNVPVYVWYVLRAMPADSHPMAMLNTAILIMQKESVFQKRYDEGMKKDEYWDATLEDALNILAILPTIAAGIYRMRYYKGALIQSDPKLDWAADYAHMLGIADPNGEFTKLMRLYMVLHSDHESGNVSAMSASTVNSALSDLYFSLSAGLNGLAGPLHGLANQECLKWILETIKKFDGVPTERQLKDYAWETLNSGQVIPGYGHAVLRITDPRFDAILAFGKKYCAGSDVFDTVSRVFDVVPDVLKEVQKIKDPWPNVDAASGALLYHYGLSEFSFYTVLFAVSRAMGVFAQAVMNRGTNMPIIRPKSVTTEWIKKEVKK